jgi:vacuolar-type H+-ATPase subunit E/Vma4
MPRIIGSGLEGYIHRQAHERALNRTAEAQEEARKLLEQAHAEAEALRQQAGAQTGRTIEERRRRATAQGQLKAKQTVLRQQEALIQRVWQQAQAELSGGTPAQRLAAIARLLTDAAQQLHGGPLEMQVNAQDRALFTEAVLQDLTQSLGAAQGVTQLAVAPAAATITGGVIVRRLDVNQLADNSYDERLALVQRTLRDQVYRLLTA